MDIVGFHVKNTTIANSEGEVISSPPYLKWLLGHPQKTIQTLYDMESCIGYLLDILGIKNHVKDELFSTTKLVIQPYKYRYIPNKFFSIKRNNHHLSYFCNMRQYFLDFDPKLLDARNGESDREYCLRMANEAKRVGIELYKALSDLGIKPVSLTSLTRINDKAKMENIDLDIEWLKQHVGERIIRY